MCWFWFEHLDTMVLVIAVFLFIAFDFQCSYGQGICWSCGTFFRRGFVAAHRLDVLCLGVFPSQTRADWHKAFFSTSLSIFLNCVGKILELFSRWMLEKVIRDARNMGFRISSFRTSILMPSWIVWAWYELYLQRPVFLRCVKFTDSFLFFPWLVATAVALKVPCQAVKQATAMKILQHGCHQLPVRFGSF